MNAIAYLDRLLDPLAEAFTPELAQKLVELRADPELERHIEDLRDKANQGSLSAEEDADYKELIEAIDIIAILQSKARRFLAQHPA
jgi:hypothetical protein